MNTDIEEKRNTIIINNVREAEPIVDDSNQTFFGRVFTSDNIKNMGYGIALILCVLGCGFGSWKILQETSVKS